MKIQKDMQTPFGVLRNIKASTNQASHLTDCDKQVKYQQRPVLSINPLLRTATRAPSGIRNWKFRCWFRWLGMFQLWASSKHAPSHVIGHHTSQVTCGEREITEAFLSLYLVFLLRHSNKSDDSYSKYTTDDAILSLRLSVMADARCGPAVGGKIHCQRTHVFWHGSFTLSNNVQTSSW